MSDIFAQVTRSRQAMEDSQDTVGRVVHHLVDGDSSRHPHHLFHTAKEAVQHLQICQSASAVAGTPHCQNNEQNFGAWLSLRLHKVSTIPSLESKP